ncbi:hypothetical protein [Ekhidna sp.]|uniref:hypothetical protein n=1 Tax=Ekhidna sp. TaxID=2608089 RepID=UPI003518B5E0
MRYLFQIIIASLLIVSCQIEDENAPAPDETYVKYYGELTSYEASDIEIIYDATGEVAEGLIVFGTKLTENGDTDYFILRTDLQGNLVDSISFGYSDTLDIQPFGSPDGLADDWTGDGVKDRFRADEFAGQIQPINGFGYAIIGSSSITINALGVSDWRWLTFGFLDLDLEPIRFLNDTLLARISDSGDQLDMVGNDIILLSSGGFLLAGGQEFDRGGGDTDFDNYFMKLNFDDGIVFESNQGISGEGEDDILVRVFEKSNGNLVMIGSSNTPSLLGENAGVNGVNVFYLETDENGTPVNSAAYGIDNVNNNVVYNDQVNNAIRLSSGFGIVGTSSTSQNQRFGFIMNLSNNGIYLSGNSHDSSLYNTESVTLQNTGRGIVQAPDNDLVMLGQYTSFTSGTNSRGGEGMFVKFDQASNPVEGAESFFGLSDGNDNIVDAVTLPDGKIVAVANVDFGGGVKLISIIKLNSDGSLD